MFENFTQHLKQVEDRIAKACSVAGRNKESVQLMAVTKTHPAEAVKTAYKQGIRLFGESRVQELQEKAPVFPEDAQVHLIGHLQRNKAKKAAPICCAVQSIDKLSTANALQKACGEINKTMDIFIEVKTDPDSPKHGLTQEGDIYNLFEQVLELENLKTIGLMTIAPFTQEETPVRRAFSRLRNLRDALQSRYPDTAKECILSMGMTNDYEIAITEGSDLIRVGSALFGQRTYT
ncbi:MAG: YggS family pyridoxal phosphate-dependent enzyme [Spirochaetia bacterium]